MEEFKSIEELVIDDSFANYCFNNNEEDFSYWNNFIEKHPEHRDEIEEARRIVLGLNTALKEKNEEKNATCEEEVPDYQMEADYGPVRSKRLFKYFMAAVITAALIIGGQYFLNSYLQSYNKVSGTGSDATEGLVYTTKKGERKMITLFDSTKIWLNADSELRIDKGYGKNERRVYLTGEALFEVKHNKKLPFMVSTSNYEVKDLGTVFNVKAYPDEETSEASLIKGKIEVIIAETDNMISLEPNQKIVLNNNERKNNVNIINEDTLQNLKNKPIAPIKTTIVLAPLSYSMVDSTVLETSWIDRLEIENENFYQMQSKLERWFGVDIKVKDSIIGNYPFTATFKNENIREALEALKYAYPFNFKIENNEIEITK